MKKFVFVVASCLASLVASTGVSTADTPVHTASDCVFWHDARTQGVACGGGPYEAWAKCDNGKIAYGHAVSGYSWSYAYCSSYGAYLSTGDVIFV